MSDHDDIDARLKAAWESPEAQRAIKASLEWHARQEEALDHLKTIFGPTNQWLRHGAVMAALGMDQMDWRERLRVWNRYEDLLEQDDQGRYRIDPEWIEED